MYPLGNVSVRNLVFDPPRFGMVFVNLARTRAGALNVPTWAVLKDNGAGSRGVWSWQFPNGSETELFFSIDIGPEMAVPGYLIPEFHFCPMTAGAGNFIMGFEWAVGTEGAVLGDTTLYTAAPLAVSGVALKHAEMFFPTITNVAYDRQVLCRIFRAGANVNDTYLGDISALNMHFHFPLDTIGAYDDLNKFGNI